MRFLLVGLFLALCAYTSSTYVPQSFNIDTANYVQRQKQIYLLYKYVNQPSYYKEHVEFAKSYSIQSNVAGYTNPDVVDYFYSYYNNGYLAKGQIFSVYNYEHLQQAIALFKLFYYAKDYETFYQTAAWARNNVNEGMYLYALSVAIIHRPDTYYYILPPIYEVYPYYFYNSEVIQQAYVYKQQYNGQGEKNYVIYANYSGYYLNLHPEQSLSYYTEDVGVNSFYYYYNLYYPFWMSGEEYNLKYDNRGELYYYIYQQILARYYLERLSNGFGEIEWFNWEVPLATGYYPSMTYPNGLEFPSRPNYAKLYEYFYNYGQSWSFKGPYGYSYTFAQDYEYRIRQAIDLGYVYTSNGQTVSLYSEDGLNVLGNLIESNPDSPYNRYYGPFATYARHLLGYSYQPLNKYYAYPSVLEHFETSLRDPVFYQLYKRLVLYFQKYKYYMKSYTKDQLYYPGVSVDKVQFDRLITYFDYYYSDITNAIYVTPEEMQQDTFHVQVAQQRLTYKPFTYKIYVTSQSEVDVVVKVYLGPKYDEYGRYINISENRINFVQFDNFKYHLKAGQNVIAKNSREIYNYLHDRSTYYEYYQKVFGYYSSKVYGFQGDAQQMLFGYPQGLYLPKGSYNGVPYQFYVFVFPYVPYKYYQSKNYPMVGNGLQYVDGYPMGYPFDRPITYEYMFYNMPNSYSYETKIYYRDASDVNATH